MLVNKIPNPVQQLKFQAGMYNNILTGVLLVVDCRLIDNLRDKTVREVQACTYKRMLLVDKETLDSSVQLVELNLCLQSLWASTTVVLKRWTEKTGSIIRTQDGSFPRQLYPMLLNDHHGRSASSPSYWSPRFASCACTRATRWWLTAQELHLHRIRS